MKVGQVCFGQEVRDLAGKRGEGELLSARLTARAVEMKSSLSTSVQGFVKNILGQKMI